MHFKKRADFYSPSHRSMGLVVSRETQHMGVPYYVDKSFEKEYRGAALDELEKTIESDYIDHLQSSCWKEKQQSKLSSHPLGSVIAVNCTAIMQGCPRLSSAWSED